MKNINLNQEGIVMENKVITAKPSTKKVYSWDSISYDDTPKTRGIFVSLVLAFLTWMIASHLLFAVISVLCISFVGVLHLFGPVNSQPYTYLQFYFFIIPACAFFDACGHFTPLVAFLSYRVEPSLREAFIFSMFGERRIFESIVLKYHR